MTTKTRADKKRASAATPAWHVVDAEGKTLGRLCTEIATLLQGKHKPIYVPHLLVGDYVVVVNADKVRVTGNKLQQKVYYRHSGYHGGLKEETLERLLQRAPTRAIKHAVKGMLPKNTIGRRALARLKLYAGGEHPHEAQLAFQAASRKADQVAAASPDEGEQVPAKASARPRAKAATSGKARGTSPKATGAPEAVAASDDEPAQTDNADDPGAEKAEAGPE